MKLSLASSLYMNNGDVWAVERLEVLNKSLKSLDWGDFRCGKGCDQRDLDR